MVWRLTREAERDLAEIARYTVTAFGVDQARRYAALIERAFDMPAENPAHILSRARDELRPAVRSFHLSRAAAKRHAASHLVYFQHAGADVLVLRVLHERMEPIRRLIDATQPDPAEREKKP
ncbi:MAG: type II toxin-antitoxin system RelE/ParE family toxin [Shinella sp.]|nr:type II toxin-antitoxin system RelE/ParE family toxin [Shinella sp.]